MFKLCVFVPVSHVEQVKQALFAAGAGRLGDYDCCSWQVLGTGQFRPLDGSQPFLGQTGVVEQVEEYPDYLYLRHHRQAKGGHADSQKSVA